jgi:glycosyltransferase involved in cell wall biosynthesis
MRRILHIIPTLDRSGAEKQLVLLAQGLPRDEFDLHVCALTRGGPLAAELERTGVPLVVLDKQWKFDPPAWWRLRRHIRALHPDLVQTWLFAANAYGRTAALSAGVAHLVASERCVDRWKSWHHLAVDRWLARRTDAIIVNSRGVEAFYRQQGIPAHKLRLIYNGIGPAPPSSISRDALLRELGLPPHARLIGAVGRLWPQKRLKDLIWATDLLQVIRGDVHLLVIGEGPQRELLARYARLCHVAERVHFLGQRDDVPRLMPHFDVLWLASNYEGLPNVVMEAMAAAVPVVASDIPGNRELVVHQQTGYLVPLGDRAGYARWAQKILEDPALRERLGCAGRRRVAAEFSVETMVAKHAALYRELLGKP